MCCAVVLLCYAEHDCIDVLLFTRTPPTLEAIVTKLWSMVRKLSRMVVQVSACVRIDKCVCKCRSADVLC